MTTSAPKAGRIFTFVTKRNIQGGRGEVGMLTHPSNLIFSKCSIFNTNVQSANQVLFNLYNFVHKAITSWSQSAFISGNSLHFVIKNFLFYNAH